MASPLVIRVADGRMIKKCRTIKTAIHAHPQLILQCAPDSAYAIGKDYQTFVLPHLNAGFLQTLPPAYERLARDSSWNVRIALGNVIQNDVFGYIFSSRIEGEGDEQQAVFYSPYSADFRFLLRHRTTSQRDRIRDFKYGQQPILLYRGESIIINNRVHIGVDSS